MKHSEQMDYICEFESPVEFVLVATKRSKRAVVAKSKGAKIDLVCYAQQEIADRNENLYPKMITPLLFPFPFPSSMRSYPIVVDSLPVKFPSNAAFDRRASELTLVWRGAATEYSTKEIKKKLQDNVDDIVSAVEFHSESSLEWALSSVIDECHRASTQVLRKRLLSIYAFWFTILIYTIVTVVFFSTYLASELGGMGSV